jgi:hypothetical protein
MTTQPFTKYRKIVPHKLGLNNVVVANGAPVTSSTFSIAGYNQLSFQFALTRVAATSVTAYVDTSNDGGTTWHRTQTKSISSGTETLSPRLMTQAVSANENWRWEFGGVASDLARLVVEGVAGTTDRLTVSAEVGVV